MMMMLGLAWRVIILFFLLSRKSSRWRCPSSTSSSPLCVTASLRRLAVSRSLLPRSGPGSRTSSAAWRAGSGAGGRTRWRSGFWTGGSSRWAWERTSCCWRPRPPSARASRQRSATPGRSTSCWGTTSACRPPTTTSWRAYRTTAACSSSHSTHRSAVKTSKIRNKMLFLWLN